MTDIRSLAEPKIASVIQANSVPLAKDILEIPTAAESTRGYTLPLTCSRTGITIGSLNLATIAGHMPMIGQWRDSMILHPLFSLQPTALLHFARNTWFRYCNFTIDEGASERLVDKQEQMLQAAALAIIYNLTEVRQDIPWLPPFKDVAAHWPSLMAISYWKNYLDSERFKFPHLHISKMEQPELKEYLQICWNVKKAYESNVNEKIEAEKLRQAEIATIALRDMLAGARPTSNRQLWRWFCAQLPKRYKKDLDTWMPEIFFAKGEEIRQFTVRDIDMLEEIFLCECPTGSSISHAFSEILDSKRKYLQQHFEAFEIIIPKEIVTAKAAGEIPVAEPRLEDFPNKVQWMVARAKWKLAHTDLTKHMNAAMARQESLTVRPSYIPTLVIRENDPDEEQEEEDVLLDGAVEDAEERDTDNSGEYET
jgi:hypothetical protein